MQEVEIWFFRLTGGQRDLLSPDESARADRFVFERDRDRYVAGRTQLRLLLGAKLRRDPAGLRFHYGPHGRPEIEGPKIERIDFNLSHTGEHAALAIARGIVVGIDIEGLRPVEDAVARRFFAPGEYAALQQIPEPERVEAFHRIWTRKEAYLKARGTGLATDLASFEVSVGPQARLVRCDSGEAGDWRLHDLAPGPGLAGAIALRSGGAPVNLIRRDL